MCILHSFFIEKIHMIYTHYFSLLLIFTSSFYAMETSLSSEFLQAALASDTPRMRNLTAKGISSDDLEIALAAAIKRFDFTTCRFIINETEVNCNAIVHGYSLISDAVYHRNGMALGLLLNKPDINLKFVTLEGLTLLELISREGFPAALSTVLAKKVYTPEECKNALLVAIYHNQNHAVIELLKYGVDPNTGYLHNKMPLHRAAERNNLRIITTLLDAGAQVDQTDNNGYTSLYIATTSSKDTRSVAQMLVARGASIEKTLNFARSIHDSDCEWNIKHWFPKQYSEYCNLQKSKILEKN